MTSGGLRGKLVFPRILRLARRALGRPRASLRGGVKQRAALGPLLSLPTLLRAESGSRGQVLPDGRARQRGREHGPQAAQLARHLGLGRPVEWGQRCLREGQAYIGQDHPHPDPPRGVAHSPGRHPAPAGGQPAPALALRRLGGALCWARAVPKPLPPARPSRPYSRPEAGANCCL